MRSLRVRTLGLISCCLLCACGASPPTRFYLLNVLGSDSTAVTDTSANDAIPVRVEAVAIPPELDRLELVSHRGANAVHVAQSARWAAPLDEQIRRVLSDDLAARLPARLLADPNEPSTQDPRRTLSVSIGQFDVSESCAVTLNASWLLHTPHAASQNGIEHIQQAAAGTCPDDMAAAMSRALAALADRLAPIVRH